MNDEEGKPVRLSLSDEAVSLILDALANASGTGLAITLDGHSGTDGVSTIVTVLQWDAPLSSFLVRIGDRTAGLIPYDELSGSLGLMFDDQDEPCMVCLSGQLDVYRRGVLNLNTGTIQVFTKTSGLGYLGAHAFLTERIDAKWDGFRITVDKGDASKGPLRIPSHQLYKLKPRRPDAISADGNRDTADIASLSSMTRLVADFHKDTKAR
ncbi:hypothetical protein [Pseudomonas syringae]|uniref:hypothetical protein n=1 Tax=Pseudomonas syringae TaxID=317 RepID=UPI00245C6F9A|nr:hypothetical protein [Pseudomonas syringae]MDH4602486.1 hypothetical protein [Pseudomonas syringae pv. papulans]